MKERSLTVELKQYKITKTKNILNEVEIC